MALCCCSLFTFQRVRVLREIESTTFYSVAYIVCRRVYVTLSMQTASNNNTNSHVWRNNFPKTLHCIESSHENWISFAHMISNIAWAFSSNALIFFSLAFSCDRNGKMSLLHFSPNARMNMCAIHAKNKNASLY